MVNTTSNSKKRKTEEDGSEDEDWKHAPPYAPADLDHPKEALYRGSCHCKNVTFELYSKPIGSQYCHCVDCQKLHGSPAHWSAALDKDAVLFTSPVENLSFYRTTDSSNRHEPPCKLTCSRCHAPICDEGKNKMLMYPSLIDFKDRKEREPFLPKRHVFYAQRALDVHDENPKFEGIQDDSPLMDEEESHGVKGVAGKGDKQ